MGNSFSQFGEPPAGGGAKPHNPLGERKGTFVGEADKSAFALLSQKVPKAAAYAARRKDGIFIEKDD